MSIHNGVASLTFQRVEFLRQFRDQVKETPRHVLEAELAVMTVHLNRLIHYRKLLFIDRGFLTYSRDCALAYFHCYPFQIRLSDNSSELIDKLSLHPELKPVIRDLQDFNQENITSDTTLTSLIQAFDPALLHPSAKRYYDNFFAKLPGNSSKIP